MFSAPAVYAQVVAMKQCFDQLEEAGVYSEVRMGGVYGVPGPGRRYMTNSWDLYYIHLVGELKEFLTPYAKRLDDFGQMIKIDEENGLLDELTLRILKFRYNQCRKSSFPSYTIFPIRTEFLTNHIDIYRYPHGQIASYYPRYRPRTVSDDYVMQDIDPFHRVNSLLMARSVSIRDCLLKIRRDMATIASQRKISAADIYPLQKKLRHIDSKRVDGVFLLHEDGSIPVGQAAVVTLLENVFDCAHDLIIAAESPNGTVEPLRLRLLEIKSQLERLQLTHKWTLRETDLFAHLMQLQEINRMRVDRQFVDEDGKPVEGQIVLIFLIHKCSRLIVTLMGESVPVSEVLMPIYNQLTTLKKCLESVASCGAPCSRKFGKINYPHLNHDCSG
jgi:hypothetical protein